MTAAVFYPSAGDVVWSGNPSKGLSEADVSALIGLYRDEARAAWRAQDYYAYAHAAELHGQIFTANFEAQKWARAAAYSNTDRKAA